MESTSLNPHSCTTISGCLKQTNQSNCSLNEAEANFPKQVALGLALGLFSLVTVSMNLLIFCAIRNEKALHTVGNMYIVSLAVADFIIGVIVMPISILQLVKGVWTLGPEACKFWLCVDYVASTASIFNLFALCVDRYRSVVSPLAYIPFRTHRRAAYVIAVAWLLSSTWIIPILSWRSITGVAPKNDCDCDTDFRKIKWFKIVTAVFNFYLPTILMIWFYIIIFLSVRRHCQHRTGANGSVRYESVAKQKALFHFSTHQAESRTKKTLPIRQLSETKGSFTEDLDTFNQVQQNNETCKEFNEKNECDQNARTDFLSNVNAGWNDRPCFYRSPSQSTSQHAVHQLLHVPISHISSMFQEHGSVRNRFTEQVASYDTHKRSCSLLQLKSGSNVFIDFKQQHEAIAVRHLQNAKASPNLDKEEHHLLRANSVQVYCPDSEDRRGSTHVSPKWNKHGKRQGSLKEQSCISSDKTVKNSSVLSEKKYLNGCQINKFCSGKLYRSERSPSCQKQYHTQLNSRLRREQKAATQLGLIVLVYLVCWIPYFVVFMELALCDENMECVSKDLHTFTIWLGYINSMLNPFIYPLCNKTFRKTIKKMVICKTFQAG